MASYRDFRPYGVPYGEVTSQWNAITEAVNNKDSEIKPLGKQAVKDELDSLLQQYKPTFGDYETSKGSGSNKHNPVMEREARATYEMVR